MNAARQTPIDATHIVTNPDGWAPLVTPVIGIAIHHTVTSISPLASIDDELNHIRAIDAYHVKQGWYGIGYHYIVFPSARVYHTGNGARAHVANRNHELVGIAFAADLSDRPPSAFEIEAAAIAVADAWNRFANGSKVELRGHRNWVVDPAWATACPGRAVEVIPQIAARAQQEYTAMTNSQTAADQQRLDAIAARLERLERIVCTNGNAITVTADNDSAPVLTAITGTPVSPGDTITLSGDAIPQFLDAMGNNLYLGLQILQHKKGRASFEVTFNDDGTITWMPA